MQADGMSDAAIASFRYNYEQLVQGVTGLLPESEIQPVTTLPSLESLKRARAGHRFAARLSDARARAAAAASGDKAQALLAKTCILKLNGGLGTSMGLEKAKSLLPVKDGKTFLDLIAMQILHARTAFGSEVAFVLMNSFSTSEDTEEFLMTSYPELLTEENIELLQNKSPKIDKATLAPASWPENPALEWCPPGHGDIYAALSGSGMLAQLHAAGIRYMFVSNSDNLGATLDLRLLTHFAEQGVPFMMECAQRTAADKKGGHLAKRASDGTLLLRESAQCPKADEPAFQDTERHQFFNTNNLWLNLDALKAKLDSVGGALPLPLIKNEKTVDPRRKSSTPVYQLETAMGAAIECFPGASAVVVPRSRFAPVKTCADLFLLRSDAYALQEDSTIALAPGVAAAPLVKLDDAHYKLVDQLDALVSAPPSMRQCTSLTVKGPVAFSVDGVVLKGAVTFTAAGPEPAVVPSGTYENVELAL